MSCTDLLADVLTRIRNGQKAGHAFVIAPSSRLIKAVLSVLQKEGYIRAYEEFEQRKGVSSFKIDLKYSSGGEPVITEIKRVSKPGRRKYSAISELERSYNGLGVNIVSTSKGVLSDGDARLANVGGEVLCSVY